MQATVLCMCMERDVRSTRGDGIPQQYLPGRSCYAADARLTIGWMQV